MALGNKHLEDTIREALENLTPEYDTSTWDLLEQRLNAEDILNPTEDEHALVDNLAIQNLSNLSVPTVADWNLFEEKLDAAEIAEGEAIDQLAYNNLHHFEAPYQTSHWQLMLQKLEEEFTLRGKLYKYKVAEIALMLLLIFTIINIQPLDSFKVIFNKGEKTKKVKDPSQIQLNEEIKSLFKATPEKTPQTQPIAAAQAPIVNQSSKSAKGSSKKSVNTNSETTDNQLSKTVNDEIVRSRENISVPDATHSPKLHPIAFNTNTESTILDRTQNRGNTSNTEKQTLPMANSLMALEISLLDNGDPNFELTQPRIEKKKPKWRLGVFSAIDVNHVYTPYDQLFDKPEYTSVANGYGGGITIALKMRRLGFESGGIYSFKRYVPKNTTFTPKLWLTENFEGVQLDILQIPFNFQYHLVNRGKWRFYVNGGAALHMLLSPVYEFAYREEGPLGLPAPLPPGEPCDQCLSNLKDFPKGILEGGSFKENAYGSANLGMGLERFISQRWSIFLQPTYQHYFTKRGVGPNDDKIYSMSIFMGTKVTIK